MRKFLTYLIVLPLFLIFVAFAVANRHVVTVSFDPFDSADPALSDKVPLFILIVAVAMLGVIVGGVAVPGVSEPLSVKVAPALFTVASNVSAPAIARSATTA